MSEHVLLGICGSLRAGSQNRKLMREAARLYGSHELIEADLRLPLYDGDLEDREGIPPAVQSLSDQIAAADAVIIASPEYNKSITGVLKNALDWVSRTEVKPWLDKPVAIMSAAAGRTGGEAGQFALRLAMASFRPRFASGPALMLAGAAREFDDTARLTSERYEKTLTALMASLRVAAEDVRRSG